MQTLKNFYLVRDIGNGSEPRYFHAWGNAIRFITDDIMKCNCWLHDIKVDKWYEPHSWDECYFTLLYAKSIEEANRILGSTWEIELAQFSD